jgi:hypothetical protein
MMMLHLPINKVNQEPFSHMAHFNLPNFMCTLKFVIYFLTVLYIISDLYTYFVPFVMCITTALN